MQGLAVEGDSASGIPVVKVTFTVRLMSVEQHQRLASHLVGAPDQQLSQVYDAMFGLPAHCKTVSGNGPEVLPDLNGVNLAPVAFDMNGRAAYDLWLASWAEKADEIRSRRPHDERPGASTLEQGNRAYNPGGFRPLTLSDDQDEEMPRFPSLSAEDQDDSPPRFAVLSADDQGSDPSYAGMSNPRNQRDRGGARYTGMVVVNDDEPSQPNRFIGIGEDPPPAYRSLPASEEDAEPVFRSLPASEEDAEPVFRSLPASEEDAEPVFRSLGAEPMDERED